jgi:hypothetical protein
VTAVTFASIAGGSKAPVQPAAIQAYKSLHDAEALALGGGFAWPRRWPMIQTLAKDRD